MSKRRRHHSPRITLEKFFAPMARSHHDNPFPKERDPFALMRTPGHGHVRFFADNPVHTISIMEVEDWRQSFFNKHTLSMMSIEDWR